MDPARPRSRNHPPRARRVRGPRRPGRGWTLPLPLLLALPHAGASQLPQALPLAEVPYVLGDDLAAWNAFIMSGGPPPDGIPAIDAPVFIAADEAGLAPGDRVIGFVHEGEARAYPQNILVYHEIVNDEVGGLSVAITYCPLTATAQGFLRGTTTLGVSGQLLNSNLVMFDRATGSWFSQIAATGLTGEHRGAALSEVEVIWTTWARWSAAHPDTKVLSERTGYLRNYARDPYGSYNPPGGYYVQDGTLFPVMHPSDRHHAKEMVVGGRTSDRSVHFVLEELQRERVQSTEHFLGVWDEQFDTGRIYRMEEGVEVTPSADGQYRVGDDTWDPDALPLEGVVAVQAFHFAWHTFYPRSESPGADR